MRRGTGRSAGDAAWPFVVGPGNRVAHAAAHEFLRAPAPAFPHLLVLGDAGAGKTHLLRTLRRALLQETPERALLFAGAAEFVTQFGFAAQERRVEPFRKKYRSAEVLLFDDLQALAGKPATQEEFLHTVKDYERSGRRVVLTSRAAPESVPGLARGLAARLAGGMRVSLDPPDYGTRLAILQARAVRMTFPPAPEALACVARQDCRSPLDLLKLFDRVGGLRNPGPLTIEAALRDLTGPQTPGIDLARVEQAVLEHFGISGKDLKSARRTPGLVGPRRICLYLGRTLTGRPLAEVGRFFGGRSHATVLHACRRMEELMAAEEAARAEVAAVRARAGSR
ncbi:MAG: ATP-binding protein [Planctomycetes bacterium]|nr:ATP-binding protein [Planctomycetota bacterium]